MNRAPRTADPNLFNSQAMPDTDRDPAPAEFGLVGWLKHFTLYLCAVVTAATIGLYFLWKIPILEDLSQLTRSTGDTRAPRPLAAAVAPPVMLAQPQPEPQATNPMAPVPAQPKTVTDDSVSTTVAPPTPLTPTGNPGVPPALEQQSGTPDNPVVPATPVAEIPPADVPPPTREAEIEQLLTEAEQQMDSRRLTAPASGNALRTYQRVLELEPNNPAALEGIHRITAYYQDAAHQSFQQGRLDESLAYISRGLRAAPKDEVLLGLRREARLAKQREQEQQALLDMKRQQAEQDYQEQLRQRALEPQQPWWRRQQPGLNEGGFNQR